MKQAAGGTEFIIIGENIHCSRIVKREGIRGGVDPDGRPGIRFPAGDGESWVPLPDSILESKEFTTSERIKHVMAAVRQGLAGGPGLGYAIAVGDARGPFTEAMVEGGEGMQACHDYGKAMAEKLGA